MAYLQTAFEHGAADRTALLLVNLGTPQAPRTGPVRRYLAEFLADPRVVEAPRWLWRAALHGVILRVRPRRSAHAYGQIWTSQGSPLAVHTHALGEALAAALAPDGVDVAVAMRYGEPSIPRVLDGLRARGNLRRLLVLPLYPQYSGTTTGSVFEAVARALAPWRYVPHLRFLTEYADDAGWLDAVAASIAARRGPDEQAHLLFSFHGIPVRYVRQGDPYYCQCLATARRVAERLALSPDAWSVSFQSRVGRERWLEPDTEAVLAALPARGLRRVQVVCPGFATDCLETLEEIAMRGAEAFRAAGGESFEYVPALNASAAHVDALASLIRRAASDWLAERSGPSPERAARHAAQCPAIEP